jgi:O-antigen/teichoic acid export membrane protein
MRLPYAALDALHEFPLKNAILAGGLLLRLGLVLGGLAWRPSVAVLAAVVLAQTVAEFAAVRIALRARAPALKLGLGGFERAMARSLFGFSLYATLLNFGTQFAYRTDALVIGAFLAPADITDFDVGNKFFDPLASFMLGIGAVVMPLAARYQAAGDLAALRAVFLRWSKIALSLVLAVGLYLVALGPEFLAWWVAPRHAQASGPVLQVLMLSFLVYLPVRALCVPVLLGLGLPRPPAVGLLVMGLVNLGISVALVRPLGILGVALGTALPNVVFAGWMLRLACRALGVPVTEYLGHVAGRCLPGALVSLALLFALKLGPGIEGLVPLLAAGAAHVVVFVAVWSGFVYRGDPHLDAGVLLRRLRGGSAA